VGLCRRAPRGDAQGGRGHGHDTTHTRLHRGSPGSLGVAPKASSCFDGETRRQGLADSGGTSQRRPHGVMSLKASRPLIRVLVINDNHCGLTFLFEL
jgi:hypothetical protein